MDAAAGGEPAARGPAGGVMILVESVADSLAIRAAGETHAGTSIR
jgi:hypothetical protein